MLVILPKMLRDALRIFTAEKQFTHPWVGNFKLNRLGLHVARMGLTDAALWLRRTTLGSIDRDALATFRRDGILVVPDALPSSLFGAVAEEVHERVRCVDAEIPRPINHKRGFGPKLPFPGGFDRFDGGTLNRFIDITRESTPHAFHGVRTARLAALSELTSGFHHRPVRFQIYVTVAGDEKTNPDPQRKLHRDTFHSTVKLWLFLDEVRLEDGPFEWVYGSHRADRRRLAWEHRVALESSSGTRTSRSGGGSFRIQEAELAELGLDAPKPVPVKANTLILADVRGFHRRGLARAGAERLALYANLRLWPFSPIAY